MEERIARLESHIEYLITQVRDVKAELSSLRDRIDAQFDALRGRPPFTVWGRGFFSR
jgi:chaperonin cofactor prefoldin